MKSRAQAVLESYDDVITGMMQQMDDYAQRSGGYINRLHPDQEKGEQRELQLSEEWRRRQMRYAMEEMSKGKKVALGVGAGAAALGAAYLAHKHGVNLPGFHAAHASHQGMGWKSKAALALGTAAALGAGGYAAHRSGLAGDAVASGAGSIAKAAEKYGITNVIPSARAFSKSVGRANAGELEGYGTLVKGVVRNAYNVSTGR